MKKKNLFRLLLVLSGLLLQFNLWAQTSLTLHVETAGTLPTLIDASQKYEITDLTLTGDLNGTDIRFIREMAGVDSIGQTTDGNLSILNLSSANIVNGGDYYLKFIYDVNYFYTESNSISDYMFSSCHLTNIILPNTATSIRGNAFLDCNNLTNITIPNSVTSIGDGAFALCSKLTSVVIPNSVISIGIYAFDYCSSLTNITIPNGVTEIETGTFYYCSSLTSVNIPKSVTEIKSYAFQNCSSLTSINIPDGVTEIEDCVFSYCTSLSSVIIGNGVTSIGGSAFQECSSLTSITIPNSVTSIWSYAFMDCNSLTSITVPNNVTLIGTWAFQNCSSLTEINSKNPMPPSTNNSFDGVDKNSCKLYVPQGSKSAYQSAPQWQDFANIIETDFTAINPINKNNCTIKSVANGISIETKETTPISVYNLSGKKVYQSIINGNVKIPLNKGVYIVKANNESEKVIVN